MADAAGEPVRVVGAGRRLTELTGRVDLGDDRSSIAALTVREPTGIALAVRGAGSDLHVEGRVRLRDGAALRSSSIVGPLVTAGQVRMHSVAVSGTGIDVESGALTANHLTLVGTGAVGLWVPAGSQATVARPVVWGFLSGVSGVVADETSAPARERDRSGLRRAGRPAAGRRLAARRRRRSAASGCRGARDRRARRRACDRRRR